MTIAESTDVDISNYTRVLPPPPPASEPFKSLMPERDAIQICSLPVLPGTFPAFDNIRDFHLGGAVPQQRSPLPPPISAQGAGVGGNATTIVSSSSSSTTTTASLPQIQTYALTVGALNPGQHFLASAVTNAESWHFFSITSSSAIRVRAYGNPLAQSLDQDRDRFTAPAFGTGAQDLIFDVFNDDPSGQLVWNFQNVTGNNTESGISQLLYITVTNISDSSLSEGTIVSIQLSPLAQ